MSEKPEAPATKPTATFQVLSISIDQIMASPHQARKMFDEDLLNGLAESMRQEGLIQPITVRLTNDTRRGGPPCPPAISIESDSLNSDDGQTRRSAPTDPIYELISGERRLRAAKLLGWISIDARVIQTISQGEAAAKGLIENLQREDLNAIEEAEGFYHLNKLSPDYWDQTKIARVTGRTQGYVSQSISLLKLAPEIQENIRRRIFSRSLGLEIGRLDDFNQQRKVISAIGKNPTVKSMRKRVDQELGWISRNMRKFDDSSRPDPLCDLWKQLRNNPSTQAPTAWGVTYKGNDTWNFWCAATSSDQKRAIAEWFQKMGNALAEK